MNNNNINFNNMLKFYDKYFLMPLYIYNKIYIIVHMIFFLFECIHILYIKDIMGFSKLYISYV